MAKNRILCVLMAAVLLCLGVFGGLEAHAVMADELALGMTLQPGDDISAPEGGGEYSYSYSAGSCGSLAKELGGTIAPGKSHRLLTAKKAGLTVSDGWEFSGWYCVLSGSHVTVCAQYSAQPAVNLTDKAVQYGLTASAQRMSAGGKVTVTVPEEYAGYVTAVTVNGKDAAYSGGVYSFSMPQGDALVDVVIDESACCLVFDAAGGSFTDGSGSSSVYVHLNDGFAQTTAPEAPVRKYYLFDGWQSTTSVVGAGEQVSVFAQPFRTVEFTALWVPDPATAVTVTLDARGGSSQSDSLLIAPGDSGVLPMAWLEGYSFLGWNTRADGSGDMYPAGSEFAAGKDCTLYACWQAASCTVTVSVKHLDRPVTDVTSIQLRDSHGHTVAGHDNGTGVYEFVNVPDGMYTLHLTRRGYSGQCGTITVQDGKVIAAVLEMEMWN